MPFPTDTSGDAPRVVIFMTAQRAADIPSGDNTLACLLPLGTATFAERVLDSCAQAGFRAVDLVVSEHPENLRERLGDGSAWGIAVNWLHAKETSTPYTVLQGLRPKNGQRMLIGHGHRWVGARLLQALAGRGGVAMQHLEQGVSWTGWFSLDDTKAIATIAAYADYDVLASLAATMQPRGCEMASPQEFAHADGAMALAQAQQLALRDTTGQAVPASWRRMPWGAMSPDAVVDPQAQLTGPVLVGPGCTVARDARVGPDTVLSRNVLVAEGAEVSETLVLPNTYIGGSITLSQSVAQGNSVQHLKWSLRTQLSSEDALLMPLVASARNTTTAAGRCLALAAAAVLAPAGIALYASQLVRGRPPGWSSMKAVTRRNETTGQLDFCRVRLAKVDTGRSGRMLGAYGALLDVAQGHRAWFGVRPRDASQWYALGRDWQILSSQAAPGLIHAPAWGEGAQAADSDALAAADVYLAVRTSVSDRWAILLAVLRSAFQRQSG